MPPESSDTPPVPASGEDAPGETNVAAHILSVFSWWREIGLAAAAAAALALALFGGLALAAPQYRASATVTLTPLEKRVDTTASILSARQAQMLGFVHHGAVAEAVLARVGDLLDEDERRPKRLFRAIGAELVNPQGRLSVSNMIRISATADDRRKARALADAWAEEYARVANDHGRSLPRQKEALETSTEEQRRKYEAAQRDLEAFLEADDFDRLSRAIRQKRNMLNRLARVRAEALADAHELRRNLRRLIEEAEGLRDQIERGEAANAASNALTITLLKAQAFASSNPLPYRAEVTIAESGAAPDLAGQLADVDALVAALRARHRRVEAVLAAWTEEGERADPADAGLIETAGPAAEGAANGVPVTAQMARLDEEVRELTARQAAAQDLRDRLYKRRNRERDALFVLEDRLRELEVADASLYPQVRKASPAFMARRARPDPVLAAILAGGLGSFAAAGGALLLGSAGRRPPLALRARRPRARGA